MSSNIKILISKFTILSGVIAVTFSPVNLFALKTVALSQSVQYTQSSNVVIENGCRSESDEYKITLRSDPSKLQDEITYNLAST